jgi:hypothetical protein
MEGMADVTENFLGQTKLVRSGVRTRFIGCFLLGKEKGDVWPRARDRATQRHDGCTGLLPLLIGASQPGTVRTLDFSALLRRLSSAVNSLEHAVEQSWDNMCKLFISRCFQKRIRVVFL